MVRVISTLIICTILTACSSAKTADVMTDEKIVGPKVITISGNRTPWLIEIEKRLKEKGFKIKRLTSQNTAVEQVSETKTEIYNEASARFVLKIDGYAPTNASQRCFGGGYRFSHINAELIDLEKNETIYFYSNSGYSENCPPLSGSIFGDITKLTNDAWE
jgi:hypothetical protein